MCLLRRFLHDLPESSVTTTRRDAASKSCRSTIFELTIRNLHIWELVPHILVLMVADYGEGGVGLHAGETSHTFIHTSHTAYLA